MKINQVICQGVILSLLAAFPIFAKPETSKGSVTPDKRFSSVKCEIIKGRIDSSDPAFNQVPNSRYDRYLINAELGTIVFAELSTPKEDYSRFNPLLTFQMISKNSGVVYLQTPSALFRDITGLPRQAWYVSSPQSDEDLGYNLIVSSATTGNYELKIAYAKPSIDFSKSQIDEIVDDSTYPGLEQRLRDMIKRSSAVTPYQKKPYLVDVNSLCQ